MKLKINQKEVSLSNLEREKGALSFEVAGVKYAFELVYRHKEKLVLKDSQGKLRQVWLKQRDRAECFVSTGAESFEFSPWQKSRSKQAALDTGSMVSPMPGKVFKVLVAEGQKVKKGETILILEAMKMEHAIKASSDGVVKKIMFQAGDLVGGGVTLAIVEERE